MRKHLEIKIEKGLNKAHNLSYISLRLQEANLTNVYTTLFFGMGIK